MKQWDYKKLMSLITVLALLAVMYISIDGKSIPLVESPHTQDIEARGGLDDTIVKVSPGDTIPLSATHVRFSSKGTSTFFELALKFHGYMWFRGLAILNGASCELYEYLMDTKSNQVALVYQRVCTTEERHSLLLIRGGV